MTETQMNFAIAKLELSPGDILVCRGPLPIGEQRSILDRLVPHGVRVLYIPPEVDLSVMTRAEIEQRT